jgi:hypothetical protein
MTQQNLIGLERAKLNCSGASTSDDRTIDALIGACSDAIIKYCKRDFHLRSYDEAYDGNGDRRLLLREYPLVSVESVRYRPVTVMKITNTDTATNQQARVTVTRDGLILMRMASGAKIVDTSVTFSANPTLTSLALAVNALGTGWSAQVVGDGSGDYGLWPSSDLYVPPSYGGGTQSQGALTARGQNAELKLHTYELAGYQWDPRGWLLRAIPYSDPELLHPEDLIWPVGINNFRIQYTAGYPTIPEAVQEACATWVAQLWGLAARDPALVTQVPGSGTTSGWMQQTGMPARVQDLLKPYRRHSIATNQG